MNRKTPLFFGPPLALLTEGESNTMEISGKVNRTAERYLEILKYHGLELSDVEREHLKQICGIGYMSPEDMRDLPDDVRFSVCTDPRLDREALADRLETACFADLVATVEALGF